MRPALAAAGLLGVATVAKLPTLAQPLTENFGWRQTQTAWTARIFHEHGIDLLRPEVPVHGPPWTLAFEFPLFQAIGALLMDVGLPPDMAMRTVGLATFLLTGVLVYALVYRLAGAAPAIATLIAFLFSPFGLLWGRTSLIEYLATAAALGFLLAAILWRDTGRPAMFGLAILLGSTAMLVKITTGVFYLLPVLAYRSTERQRGGHRWPVVLLVMIPSAVGLAWTAHADAIRAASPSTAFLTSAALVPWNFGTPAMRFDVAIWTPFAAALFVGLAGAGLLLWLPMAVAFLRQHPQRSVLTALLVVVIVGPPVVLTPLYSTQNYYPAALSPVVAILVGLGAAWAWKRRTSIVARVALAIGVSLWAITLVMASGYWTDSYRAVVDRDGSLAAARFISERTEPGDWVVVGGRYWDPTVLYYAERRGYMLDPRRDEPGTLDRLRADGRYSLFVNCTYQDECRELHR